MNRKVNLSKISRFFQDFLELSRFFKIFPNLYRFFQNFLFFFQNIVNFQDFLQILLISINFPKKSLFLIISLIFPFFENVADCSLSQTFQKFQGFIYFYQFFQNLPFSTDFSSFLANFPEFSRCFPIFRNYTLFL